MELKTQIRRYMLGILFMLALAKSIYAASAYQIFSNAVSWLGRPSFVLVVTLVMFFILLYAIFASGLGFVKAFTKEDKSLTKNGKLVAVSMSLISTLGVFGYGYATGGAYNMMAQLPAILGTFGTIAAWTVSVLIAALVWFLYKDLPMHMQKEDDALNKRRWMRIGLTLLCFGMSFWIFGNLLSKTDFSEFGVAFIFLGVISIFIGSVIKSDEERAQAKAEKEAGESGSSGTTSDGDTKKYGTVEGVVKDEDGPIGNATVTIDNRNPVTTDSSGKFVFGQQEFGNFNIKYEADKHATAVRNYTLDKNKLDLGEVILAKEEKKEETNSDVHLYGTVYDGNNNTVDGVIVTIKYDGGSSTVNSRNNGSYSTYVKPGTCDFHAHMKKFGDAMDRIMIPDNVSEYLHDIHFSEILSGPSDNKGNFDDYIAEIQDILGNYQKMLISLKEINDRIANESEYGDLDETRKTIIEISNRINGYEDDLEKIFGKMKQNELLKDLDEGQVKELQNLFNIYLDFVKFKDNVFGSFISEIINKNG